jgi:polyisoprenoid-binding protein YceI
MTRRTTAIATLVLMALAFVPPGGAIVPAGAPAGTWRIDPGRSMVQFTVAEEGV